MSHSIIPNISRYFEIIDAVKCNTPLTEENVIANYSYPALEGTNVTFTCSAPSLVFNGSNSSTCMGNGEWEPDPMDVKCISKGML